MSERITSVQKAVEKHAGCRATHRESVRTTEGVIDVFDLSGHPKAKQAYGWQSIRVLTERLALVLAVIAMAGCSHERAKYKIVTVENGVSATTSKTTIKLDTHTGRSWWLRNTLDSSGYEWKPINDAASSKPANDAKSK